MLDWLKPTLFPRHCLLSNDKPLGDLVISSLFDVRRI